MSGRSTGYEHDFDGRPMRQLIAGNWKMNESPRQARALARQILDLLPERPLADVLLIPPYPALGPVHSVVRQDSRVSLGAQNCHWEDAGAYTGEVSAPMLSEWCQYTLVGHSERRVLFQETDEQVRAKLEAVLRSGMRAVLALGETREERDAGRTEEVLTRQCRSGLMGLGKDRIARCTVAYEPVWAIGSGAAADPSAIAEAAGMLRSVIEEAASGAADQVRILYGGSVTARTAPALLGAEGVSGALVGGASLNAAEFCGIVAAAPVLT